jgi:hypothetical protein
MDAIEIEGGIISGSYEKICGRWPFESVVTYIGGILERAVIEEIEVLGLSRDRDMMPVIEECVGRNIAEDRYSIVLGDREHEIKGIIMSRRTENIIISLLGDGTPPPGTVVIAFIIIHIHKGESAPLEGIIPEIDSEIVVAQVP